MKSEPREPPSQKLDASGDAASLSVSRRAVILGTLGMGLAVMRPQRSDANSLPSDPEVAAQPFFSNLIRVIQALHLAGEPLESEDEGFLRQIAESPSVLNVHEAEQRLAKYTLLRVRLNEHGLGDTRLGDAPRQLVEQGWRTFLIRVENPFSLAQELAVKSDSGGAEGELSTKYALNTQQTFSGMERIAEPEDLARRWFGYQFFSKSPLLKPLSGIAVEYRILQIFSRDRGSKTAWLSISALDTPLILLREKNGIAVDFDCLPSSDLALTIRDFDGRGTTGSLVIRDELHRLYPAPAHRIEPDLDFQPQIYRSDGESVRLPEGRFEIEVWRGPEYVRQHHTLVVSKKDVSPSLELNLQRWVDAAALGWYPGDTHIHAAGCAHYEIPTTGVTPETMLRHVRGEALSVGDVLTWAPGFYYQKRFFTGHTYRPTNALGNPEYQRANNTSLNPKVTPHALESMLRYDIEVSGFPCSHSGHLVLLRLKQQDYRGVRTIDEWPSWNLPVARWAKAQGAVVGYAHCGDGMAVKAPSLPNYDLPAFDMDGANEFVVDVTHDAVDFVSCVGNPPVTELNFWYHALNCGFRVPMVGETDFPCFSDERVGTNRTYVGLAHAPRGDAGFSAWVAGIKEGRVYFGDGRSHFIDYRINSTGVGRGDVHLEKPGKVVVEAKICARLEETPVDADEDHLTPKYGYWNLERARLGKSRTVPLEIVVNGVPVVRREFPADGTVWDLSEEIAIDDSSWVTLRILPSGHTSPIYVTVADRPTRVSRRSAAWSLACIDALWEEKGHRIRISERAEAAAAYESARRAYSRIRAECLQD